MKRTTQALHASTPVWIVYDPDGIGAAVADIRFQRSLAALLRLQQEDEAREYAERRYPTGYLCRRASMRAAERRIRAKEAEHQGWVARMEARDR